MRGLLYLQLANNTGLARTLRPTEDSNTRSTPYEIARDHGHAHLYDLLCPVVRRPIDPRTLQELQNKLHTLIEEFFPSELLKNFLLPELEVLTEFEHSNLWFPLFPEATDIRGRTGVRIILERDALVAVLRHTVKRTYRVSKHMVREISEADISY